MVNNEGKYTIPPISMLNFFRRSYVSNPYSKMFSEIQRELPQQNLFFLLRKKFMAFHATQEPIAA